MLNPDYQALAMEALMRSPATKLALVRRAAERARYDGEDYDVAFARYAEYDTSTLLKLETLAYELQGKQE